MSDLQEDNADRLYKESRQRDKQAEIDALLEMDARNLDMLHGTTAPELDALGAPAAPGAAPASPTEPQPQDPNARPIWGTGDAVKSALRGPIAEAADVNDNVVAGLTGIVNYLGFPEDAPLRTLLDKANAQPKVRETVDKALGTPQTVAGEMIQAATGQIAYVIPGTAALRGASLWGNIAKGAAVSAAVAGATTQSKDTNASTALEGAIKGTWAENDFVKLLSVDTDDTHVERILKTMAEDVMFSAVAESVSGAVRGFRGWRKGQEAIGDAAARTGAKGLEPATSSELDALVAKKAEADMAQKAVDDITAAKGTADGGAAPAAETAAKGPAVATLDEQAKLQGFDNAEQFKNFNEVPLGLRRPEKLDPALAQMDDASFETHLKSISDEVDALEKQMDESHGNALYNDRAGMEMLAAKQDAYASAELEKLRRSLQQMEPRDLFNELRDTFRNKNSTTNLRAALITSTIKNRGLSAQVESAIKGYAGKGADEAELMGWLKKDLQQLNAEGLDPSAVKPKGLPEPAPTATVEAAPASPPIPPEYEAAAQAKAAQTAAEALDHQNRVVDQMLASETDGRVLEATRQNMDRMGVLSKENNARLGAAADARMPAPDADPHLLAGNYLKVTAKQAAVINEVLISGNPDEAAKHLGDLFDPTNLEKISADGNITGLLNSVHQLTARNKNSRVLRGVETLPQNLEGATKRLEQLAKESGQNPVKIVEAMSQAMPDIKDLSTKITTLRLTEMALGHKTFELSKTLTHLSPAHEKAAFARMVLLYANVSDFRKGYVSQIGRSLGSMRNIVGRGAEFTQLLDGFDTQAIADIVKGVGGEDNLLKLAEGVRKSGNADIAGNLIEKVVKGATISDMAYTTFVSNLLSGVGTQTLNMTSNIMRGMVLNPGVKFAEATSLALRKQSMDPYKAWLKYLNGLTVGARVALVNNGAILHGEFSQGTAAQAFRAGERITGAIGGTGKFAEGAAVSGAPNLFNRGAWARLIREGSGLAGKPLLMIPRAGRDAMASWIESRSGIGAKSIDFIGRVMEYPGRLLASGDEMASAISYHGSLHGDVAEHLMNSGYEGAAFSARMDMILADIPRVGDLAKNIEADPLAAQVIANRLASTGASGATSALHLGDPMKAATDYVKMLTKFDKDASHFARRATYTEPAGDKLQAIMKMRDTVPLARWFMPFLKTPTNILKSAVVDTTPVGGIMDMMKASEAGSTFFKGASDDMAKAQGKAAAALGVFSGISYAISQGTITDGGPHNPQEREIWMLSHEPYSIWMGDTIGWVPYSRFDPMGITLGVMADIHAVYASSENGDSMVEEAWGRLLSTLESKSYLQGLSSMMHMIQQPDVYGPRMIVSTVENTMIPGSRFWAGLERGGFPGLPADLVAGDHNDGAAMTLWKDTLRGDPTQMNNANNLEHFGDKVFLQLGQTIKSDLPAGAAEVWQELWNTVMSEKMKLADVPQLDFYGDVRTIPAAWGPDTFSPFYGQHNLHVEDPVSDELARVGYGFGIKQRFGSINDIALTPKQQHDFQMAFAKPHGQPEIREMLKSEMLGEDGKLSEEWKNRTDSYGKEKGGKEVELDRLIGHRMESARKAVLNKYPELRAQIHKKKLDAIRMRKPDEQPKVIAERKGTGGSEILNILSNLKGR